MSVPLDLNKSEIWIMLEGETGSYRQMGRSEICCKHKASEACYSAGLYY